MPAAGPVSKAAIVLAAASLFATAAVAAGGISLEHPWLRFIIKDRPAGGYFTLHNQTDGSIELTGASSSGCGMIMLHQSKETNGVEQMLPVKSVTVPAHGTLAFAPGGYHLMCMHPQPAVKLGGSVPVTLTFADGRTVTADFPVKGPADR